MLVSKPSYAALDRFHPNIHSHDLGFAKMLSAAIGATPNFSQTDTNRSASASTITHLEQLFLSQWKVPLYEDVFADAVRVIQSSESAFARYEERLEQIESTFLRYEINRFTTLGMNSGGLFSYLSDYSNLSDTYFLNVWEEERSMFGWEKQNLRLLDSVASLGIAKKLAQASENHSLSRQQAALSGQLMPFVSDILNQAFNSDIDGIMRHWQWDMPTAFSLGAGEPVSDVINLQSASAQSFRSFGRHLYQQDQLTLEEYSIAQHLEQLTTDKPDHSSAFVTESHANWLSQLDNLLERAPDKGLVAYWGQSLKEKLSRYI
ncbi:MAG: hypothetical protein ACPGPF_06120 [Pontibacterium sp.]